jgi:hypothetical protein
MEALGLTGTPWIGLKPVKKLNIASDLVFIERKWQLWLQSEESFRVELARTASSFFPQI